MGEELTVMTIDKKDTSTAFENSPDIVKETLSESTRLYLQQLNSYEPARAKYSPSETPLLKRSWWRGITSPLAVLFIAIVVMVALVFYGFGASATSKPGNTNTASSNPSSTNMATTSSTNTNTANVPNATQDYGNQPARYVIDPDGARHFTLTAIQVMWEPVKGQRVLAWTINGTVPGPIIPVTAGYHARVTLVTHFHHSPPLHSPSLLV